MADVETFERGIEELMNGQLDDCVSFESCSSPRILDDEEEDSDQLVRRRRCDREGHDLAESSGARGRHSRMLRQAEEMMTSIERRNRESELMALAGLHTNLGLNSSFSRESRSPSYRERGTVERASVPASTMLQMWRELEDEHLLNRAEERVRERLRQRRSAESRANVSSTDLLESQDSENEGSLGDVRGSENEFGTWSHGQMESQDEYGDNNISSREQSPDLGEIERERVREILRGWMQSDINDHSPRNNNSRGDWLGETERERVRIIREWMQMTSQQRGSPGERGEEQAAGLGARVDQVRNGLGNEHAEGRPENIRRDMLRLRGRQALIDLLVRIERERQRELRGLLEHRAVSDFAHRNRIQSLLRGRFLRSENSAIDERPPSVAASELVQLRQQHPVSGLREGLLSGLDNIVPGRPSSHSYATPNDITSPRSDQTQTNTSQEVEPDSEHLLPGGQEMGTGPLPDLMRNLESDTVTANMDQEETTYRGDGSAEVVGGNLQRDHINNLPQEPARHIDVEQVYSQASGVHHQAREAVANQAEGRSVPQRAGHTFTARRYDRFYPPDDHNVYSMELRELLSRRSVSNLLHSEFRESLDQLILSYMERQGRAPMDWDLPRNLPTPTPASLVQDQEEQRNGVNEAQQDTINEPPLVLPPVPPPRPLWHQVLQHTGWSRHSIHRSELEWDMINDLRADMSRLQQGMNHMQRMLESCMDMQLELQRSVRQEVSAALNGSAGAEDISFDGSKWDQVRKGTCCICCDSHIDSLLYRCGHMCTCAKCANELVRRGGKCPLCRAPIVEVIRAYSVA